MSQVVVTTDDQSCINKFSSMSVAQAFLEDRLAAVKKAVAACNDAVEELDLVLEDDIKIPCRYGDIFIMSDIEAVKEHCGEEIRTKEEEIVQLSKEVHIGSTDLASLKSKLSSKFGDNIRLDYD